MIQKLVRTKTGSAYLVDEENMTEERLKVGEDSVTLRRDGEILKIYEILLIQEGYPMSLLIDIRGDGMPTWRVTSEVLSIEELHMPEGRDKYEVNV